MPNACFAILSINKILDSADTLFARSIGGESTRKNSSLLSNCELPSEHRARKARARSLIVQCSTQIKEVSTLIAVEAALERDVWA